MRRLAPQGRHRLGTPGLVHCLAYRQVFATIAEYRRTWLRTGMAPGRHSLAGLRRRAVATAMEHAWAPAIGRAA
jgi:hypothetical protein